MREKKYISQYIQFLLVFCFLLLFSPPPSFIYPFVKAMIPMHTSSLTYRDLNRYSYVVEHFDFRHEKYVQVCTCSFFEPISIATKLLLIFEEIYLFELFMFHPMLWLWCNSHISYLISLRGPTFEILLPKSFCNGQCSIHISCMITDLGFVIHRLTYYLFFRIGWGRNNSHILIHN